MKELKKGNFVLILDDDVFDVLKNENFIIGKNKNMYYARINKIYVHRYVMEAKKGTLVDHKNGNGLDNRKDNLRIISYQGNKANQKFGNDRKTSKFIGVGKSGKLRFKASAKFEGKNKHLGCFSTEIEAAIAYDKFTFERFGDLAVLNFPYIKE